MSIQKNTANTLRLYMTENSKTILELADELEIARSSLQNYLKGKGNPSNRTIEQIAEKMEMDPENYAQSLCTFLAADFYTTRRSLGLTQTQMAEQLKIEPRSYSNLEHGRSLCGTQVFFLYLFRMKKDQKQFLFPEANADTCNQN